MFCEAAVLVTMGVIMSARARVTLSVSTLGESYVACKYAGRELR